MLHKTTHIENLIALKRIEGQVKGIQNMIDDKKYCIDIATQVYASIGGLRRVAEKILSKHMEHCVVEALGGKSEKEKRQKIDELLGVIKRLNKL